MMSNSQQLTPTSSKTLLISDKDFFIQPHDDFIDQYELYPDNFPQIYDDKLLNYDDEFAADNERVVLNGETRIEYLGNIRVWELASCFLFIAVVLLFLFYTIVRVMKRSTFDDNELMEKALLSQAKLGDDKIKAVQKNENCRSLSSFDDTMSTTSSRPKLDYIPSSVNIQEPEKVATTSNNELVLNASSLAYTNKCMVLDDECIKAEDVNEKEMNTKDNEKKLEVGAIDSSV